jgi:hypothetical protein
VNHLFSSVALARLPSSARGLRIERQGRGFGARTVYIRFEADADAIARFAQGSPLVKSKDSTPMASIGFGPRCPTWMRWDTSVEGRAFHYIVHGTSVWVMIDEKADIVYVGVYGFRPRWLRRLME